MSEAEGRKGSSCFDFKMVVLSEMQAVCSQEGSRPSVGILFTS